MKSGKRSRWRTLAGALALGVLALVAAPAAAQEDDQPEATKKGGSIRYNNSARIPYHSWATVSYTVSNPGGKDADVLIRVTPMGQRNVTIYETALTVGAGLQYAFHNPITIGTVDSYAVDMFLDRNLVTDQNARLTVIRLANLTDHFIIFINDDTDLTYGLFSKNENLDATYVNALNAVDKAATHFASYDNAHIVVLYRPNFNRMTTRQYTALLDYVARGGTLIFGDPGGALAAWDTPLRKCMPITPLRVRQLERLDALTSLGGKPAFWPEGIQFLESLPRGDGLTTLTHEDFPLVRWGRFGLGKVGFCAVNPSAELFRKENNNLNFDVYWRHLLSFGGHLSYASSTRDPGLTEALDKLTGIEIPAVSLIRDLLLVYLALILVFVSGGYVLRRNLEAWIALAVVAVLAALGVFSYARYRQRDLSPKTATVLEFRNLGVEEQSAEQLVSLTLKSDRTLDLVNPDVDLLVRSLPPPRQKRSANAGGAPNYAQMRSTKKKDKDAGATGPEAKGPMFGEAQHGEEEELRDPLKIFVENGRSSLRNLNLRDGKPQFYSSLYVAHGETIASPPEVRWTEAGPEIKPWPLPAGAQPEFAALVCEAGYIPLQLAGGKVSLTAGYRDEFKQPSAEYVALSAYLSRNPAPAPAVVLFSRLSRDNSGYLGRQFGGTKESPFKVVGREIQLVPLIEALDADRITVPFERIRVAAQKTEARVLQQDNEWTAVTASSTQVAPPEYELDCFLPPGHNRLQIKELMVDFVAENRGNNIDFKLFVKRGRTGPRLPLVSRKDGTFAVTLSPEDGAAVVDPSNGHFAIVLTATPRTDIRDHLDRLRRNTWKITRLRVAATGELPPAQRGRL